MCVKMEVLALLVLFGLAAQLISAQLCTPHTPLDNNGNEFWACMRGLCTTVHIMYNGITVNPTITFCESTLPADGSKCHIATSNHLCDDISLLLTLTVPSGDLVDKIKFKVGLQPNALKVCFGPSTDDCSGTVVTPPPTTGPPNPSDLLTDNDRQKIVDTHNQLRGNVNPTAADMMQMKYDKSLETVAQNFIDTLTGCPLQHSQGNYGENLYKAGSSGTVTNIDFESVVKYWHKEEANYDYNSNSCQAGKKCGHYKQVVWADSDTVGCAAKICPESGDEMTYTLVVCNYDPSGNAKDKKPYTQGTSCSLCPSNYTCQNNLCVAPALTYMMGGVNDFTRHVMPKKVRTSARMRARTSAHMIMPKRARSSTHMMTAKGAGA